jgi:hypothetical protein
MSDSPSVTRIIRSQADKALATGNVERASMLLELASSIEEPVLDGRRKIVNFAA